MAGAVVVKGRSSKIRAAKDRSPMAIHGSKGDSHIVGFGNIKVIVCEDDGIWFAQGLDIDYAAEGTSLRNVQENFQTGLAATVRLHLQAFSTIENLLVPAPTEVWKELTNIGKHFKFTQIKTYDFSDEMKSQMPYSGIDFIEGCAEATA
jgi:hypothetical protein